MRLAKLLPARARPEHVRITEHPLGLSEGDDYGRFKCGFTFHEVEEWKGGVSGMPGFVNDACRGLDGMKSRGIGSPIRSLDE